MEELKNIINVLEKNFSNIVKTYVNDVSELVVEVSLAHLVDLCSFLKNDPSCKFEQLIDLCGVDYLHYGLDETKTSDTAFNPVGANISDEPDESNVSTVSDKPNIPNTINASEENDVLMGTLNTMVRKRLGDVSVLLHVG